MLKAMTEAEHRAIEQDVPYYRNRWNYHATAIRLVESRKPATLLEIGPSTHPLFRGCDTMDIWGTPTYMHDARITPWPIADKAYDVVLALQVWEHLVPDQAKAFTEVVRVAKAAVLSFPYHWTSCGPGDEHYMITDEIIGRWTLGLKPAERLLIRDTEERLILSFHF